MTDSIIEVIAIPFFLQLTSINAINPSTKDISQPIQPPQHKQLIIENTKAIIASLSPTLFCFSFIDLFLHFKFSFHYSLCIRNRRQQKRKLYQIELPYLKSYIIQQKCILFTQNP